jgi:hypothetical protein
LLPDHDFATRDEARRAAALAQLQDIIVRIQQVVWRLKGNIRQLITDDKGTVIILVFGLLSGDGAACSVRGVRASLHIHHSLATFGVPIAIGVTTAKVFCGVSSATALVTFICVLSRGFSWVV